MIRFAWKVVSNTQVELTVRDGCRVIYQRFDKTIFWITEDGVQATKRRLEREVAKRLGRLS